MSEHITTHVRSTVFAMEIPLSALSDVDAVDLLISNVSDYLRSTAGSSKVRSATKLFSRLKISQLRIVVSLEPLQYKDVPEIDTTASLATSSSTAKPSPYS